MRALPPAAEGDQRFRGRSPHLFDGIGSGIVELGAALAMGGAVTNLMDTGMALKLLLRASRAP